MERGNVLVIGNSGVGKSTLINAVLGEDRAVTGWGVRGTTNRLQIYESERLPFRLIDTIGFEQSYFKQREAIRAVRDWSKESTREGREDTQISVVWLCVDGTARKLFPETLHNMARAVSMWKDVPVIVVITKSYSVPERADNIQMVHQAFAGMKRNTLNLRRIIPVVAQTYVLNESAYAGPEGITELIMVTNELIPEGIRAAQSSVAAVVLDRKRSEARAVTAAAAAAGMVVAAVPIPFPDGAILGPTEILEINTIARIYGIKNTEQSKRLMNSIVEVGTVGAAAHAAIAALKAIPGLNIAASALNAAIAGSIITALGEGSAFIFEKIYLGEKSPEDINWITKVLESRIAALAGKKGQEILKKIGDERDPKKVAQLIMQALLSINP